MTKPQEFNLYGFEMKDIIQFAVYGVALIVFLVKSDMRITTVEKSFEMLVRSNTILTEFMIDSDAYHSSVLGTQFKGGKPVNASYNTKKIRDKLIGNDASEAAQ